MDDLEALLSSGGEEKKKKAGNRNSKKKDDDEDSGGDDEEDGKGDVDPATGKRIAGGAADYDDTEDEKDADWQPAGSKRKRGKGAVDPEPLPKRPKSTRKFIPAKDLLPEDSGVEDDDDRPKKKKKKSKGKKQKKKKAAKKKKRRKESSDEDDDDGGDSSDDSDGSSSDDEPPPRPPSPEFAPHPDDEWIENGPTDAEVLLQDPLMEVERRRRIATEKLEAMERSMTEGRVNSRKEFCYPCDVFHTVDPNTQRNDYLDNLNKLLQTGPTTTIHMACARAQSYYDRELLPKTKKIMTQSMWFQHILLHNPTPKMIAKRQHEELQKLELAATRDAFPLKDRPFPAAGVFDKKVRTITHLMQHIRAVNHYAASH